MSTPSWYDEDNNKTCGHDAGHHVVKDYTGYSDFLYLLLECNACDEQFTGYIEG